MIQAPKKKRQLSKSIHNLPDHDFMEKIVGKRTMKAIDKAVAENNKDVEKIGLFKDMKGF